LAIKEQGFQAMAGYKILTLWNEKNLNEDESRILRAPCREAAIPFDKSALDDIETLVDAFLERDDALGLAAPQIGISRRMIVFRNKGFDDSSEWTKSEENYDILINPRITQERGEKIVLSEGCLSCPEIRVDIGRFPEIKVRALDRSGKKINKRYTDFLARVVQHEIDHLDGRLIVDYEGTLYYPKKRQALFERLFPPEP
jgi:peptide deformylase